jgi:phosphoribosyl-ATP pyrophosphohydrolase
VQASCPIHVHRRVRRWRRPQAANDGGVRNCYVSGMARFTIADLEQRITDRANASAEESYTRKLLDKGAAQCAKKFGEEAVEAVLAAVSEERDRVVAESADVFYHLLVMMHARGVQLSEVEALLESRSKKSGLEEKASRPDK